MGYSVKSILDLWSWCWKRFFIHHTGNVLYEVCFCHEPSRREV